jgi:hypothetical protein
MGLYNDPNSPVFKNRAEGEFYLSADSSAVNGADPRSVEYNTNDAAALIAQDVARAVQMSAVSQSAMYRQQIVVGGLAGIQQAMGPQVFDV